MHKSISANVDTVPRKNLNEFLRPYIEKHAFKGIACLFDSDGRQIIHSSSAEYTIKTKFRIASLSKPFLALLILREFEDLDTYLSSDLFPLSDGCQFPSVWSTITIRQLLSHESGIPDCLSNKELYDVATFRAIQNTADNSTCCPEGSGQCTNKKSKSNIINPSPNQ